MDRSRRKELQEQYAQVKTYMGVAQITNLTNGKRFIAGYPNLKNKWLTLRMQLESGRFANLELQADWKALGDQSFAYEVLEQKSVEDISDVKWAVKQLEKAWLDRLQPYGEKGYNKPRD